jgi:squalene-hopene/tetraprenyl-beta-curcumene cyclase
LDFSRRLQNALDIARKELLAPRAPDGGWPGELSASALATATAVCALAVADRHGHPASIAAPSASRIDRGLIWLARNVNADGGWGDTTLSLSNISTTTLGWAAFGVVPGADDKYRSVVRSAEKWLSDRAGNVTADKLAQAIISRYGKDRTFSVPILTMCAISGRLGPGPAAWRRVIPLPFELAALPQQLFAALRLPVVSYALPALIAIGQARHHHLPTRNPVARLVRNLARARTLGVLTRIQPSSGGFLEATPLTSFVTLSLASSGQIHHPVTKRGVEFLGASQRADGSWPIDTNLATWVTTLSVNALAAGGNLPLDSEARGSIRGWLLRQQCREAHPYTNAAPGGWAWTDLPGGVPDADDTAGALLALKNLGEINDRVRESAADGVHWLLDLQNADGGIPTFCRGWTNLPFDRSSPDLTAHALRAWSAWLNEVPVRLQNRVRVAMERAVRYLARNQNHDHSWTPLWFGNQHARGDTNPAYGTAKVLLGLQSDAVGNFPSAGLLIKNGAAWFSKAQNSDGSWGGDAGIPGTIEETALAVESLAGFLSRDVPPGVRHTAAEPAWRGAEWLIQQVENGSWTRPSPIGFYFAKLWYFERLYPLIFTVGALGALHRALSSPAASARP